MTTTTRVWGFDVADGSDVRVDVTHADLDGPGIEVQLEVHAGDARTAHVALSPTDADNLAAMLTEAAAAARRAART